MKAESRLWTLIVTHYSKDNHSTVVYNFSQKQRPTSKEVVSFLRRVDWFNPSVDTFELKQTSVYKQINEGEKDGNSRHDSRGAKDVKGEKSYALAGALVRSSGDETEHGGSG